MTGHKWKRVSEWKEEKSTKYVGWHCSKCGCLTYKNVLLGETKPSRHEVLKYRDGSVSLTCEERIAAQLMEE